MTTRALAASGDMPLAAVNELFGGWPGLPWATQSPPLFTVGGKVNLRRMIPDEEEFMAEPVNPFRQPLVFVPLRTRVPSIRVLPFVCPALLIGIVTGNLLVITATAVLGVVFAARGFFVGVEIEGPELRRRRFYSGRQDRAFRLEAVTVAQWEWMTGGRFRPEPPSS